MINENVGAPESRKLSSDSVATSDQVAELQRERDELVCLLSKLVGGEVGRNVLFKLEQGQGTETEDGAVWLAAQQMVQGLHADIAATLESLAELDAIEKAKAAAASIEQAASEKRWSTPGWRKLFHEAISSMLKVPPSFKMAEDYLDGEDVDGLQQFCVDHMKLEWAMGISVIDAAYMFVDGAFENANIDGEGNLWPVAQLNSLSFR